MNPSNGVMIDYVDEKSWDAGDNKKKHFHISLSRNAIVWIDESDLVSCKRIFPFTSSYFNCLFCGNFFLIVYRRTFCLDPSFNSCFTVHLYVFMVLSLFY